MTDQDNTGQWSDPERVYDRARTSSRRDFLKASAGAGVAGLAGCVGANAPSPTSTPTTTTMDLSPVEEEALSYAEGNYGSVYISRLKEFIQDEELDQRFIDNQLKLWMDAPESVRRGDTIVHNYKSQMLEEGALYMND
ncbi:MAG: twin-arginine translocation signal domain-containing protein, partial [Candidatus Nanohaloarchaea archaeon]